MAEAAGDAVRRLTGSCEGGGVAFGFGDGWLRSAIDSPRRSIGGKFCDRGDNGADVPLDLLADL
jgi:hypothetical protein